MPRPDDEAERIRRVTRAYDEDPRKQRAWDEANPGNRAMRREVVRAALRLAAAPLASELPLLDVGCGTGGALAALAERLPVDRLHGVDLVAERVDEARRRVPGAHVRLGDGRALPYADGAFGVVLLFTVLSSVDAATAAAVVREARRVRAPGGLVLVHDLRVPTPNPDVRRIGRRELLRLLGPDARLESLTVLPPLARRAPARLYPVLAAVPPLRTHWLAAG